MHLVPKILIALLAAVAALHWAHDARADEKVTGPVYFHWGDDSPWSSAEPPASWKRHGSLVEVPTKGGPIQWLAMRLPKRPGDAVLIPAVYTQFDAYVGDQHIGLDHDPNAGGRAFRVLSLPSDAARKWLKIRVTSTYSKTGIRGDIRVGSRQSLLEGMLRGRTSRIAPAFRARSSQAQSRVKSRTTQAG